MATKGVQVELLLGGVMDDGDVALAGGKVFTYAAGTLTNKTTWTDRDKTTPATNPIILDAAGKATVFADGVYKFVIKDADDVTIRTIDNLEFGFALTSGIFTLSKGADIVSANALTLGADGNYFDVTGTTAITSIGTVGVGTVIKLHFDAILTLTHHGTNLILPGAANITTAAGDEAEFIEYASGDWRCTNYTRANGSPVTILDEDDMVSDSATKVPSQQSVKAYAAEVGHTHGQGTIDANAIGQGELKDSTGVVSTTGNVNLTLPGGSRGFYPQTRHTGTAMTAFIVSAITQIGSSYVTNISLNAGSDTAFAQQRYITASAPYNLGNGDIPLFVFAIVDDMNGEVVGTYAADTPPWVYNGRPRNTFDPEKYKKKKGKANFFYDLPRELPNKEIDFEAYLEATTNPQYDEIEITPAMKNLDIDIIPHPFLGNDLTDKSVVLLDPVGLMAEKMLNLHDMGESVADLLHDRYLLIDNEDAGAISPVGVKTHKVKWKNS